MNKILNFRLLAVLLSVVSILFIFLYFDFAQYVRGALLSANLISSDQLFSVGDVVQVSPEVKQIGVWITPRTRSAGIQSGGSRGVIVTPPNQQNGYSHDGFTWWYVDYEEGPDGWSAGIHLESVDDLTAEPGKESPAFGIYYYLDHCRVAEKNLSITPPDMTKVESIRGDQRIQTYENYINGGYTAFWQDKPQLGYYCIDDSIEGRLVAKAHATQLKNAGIDFVFVDFTNNSISPRSLNANSPKYCGRADLVRTNPITGKPVSGCLGFNTAATTADILTAFRVLLEEWAKVEGAPKIVPWVPMTSYNGANFVFVKGSEIKHDLELTIDAVLDQIKGNGDGPFGMQYGSQLFIRRGDSKPLLLNTINHIFPEDKETVSRVERSGFIVESLWARFPNKAELKYDYDYLKTTFGFDIGTHTFPLFNDYPTLVASFYSAALPTEFAWRKSTESPQVFIRRIHQAWVDGDASTKTAITSAMKVAALNVQRYYWHSVDVDNVWYWRSPCKDPKSFKESQATVPCDQRTSADGKVVPISTAFEWVSFTEERTSVPTFNGDTLRRYFDTLHQHKDTAEIVLIDSWNEWISTIRLCDFNAAGLVSMGENKKLGTVLPPRATDDLRSETALKFEGGQVNYWLEPGRDFESSKTDVICQYYPGLSRAYRWLVESENNPTKTKPHFHHHWIGGYVSDIEPSADGDNLLYQILTNQIKAFKNSL